MFKKNNYDAIGLYTIRYKLAKQSWGIFESSTHATAWLTFTGTCKKQELNQSHYELYYLGTWSPSQNKLSALSSPREIQETDYLNALSEEGVNA